MILYSIAGSAAIWGIASALLILASRITDGLGRAGLGWHADFWTSWIQPALKLKEVHGTDLLPGVVLSAAAVMIGAGTARLLLTEHGRIRVIAIGVLKFDLNARVWTWFLQQPSPGAVYRVRLKSGATFVGQVAAYSSDPSDDRQDLVLEFYSAVAGNGIATPVFGSDAMILSRDDIETIERLRVTIPERAQQEDGGRDRNHAE